jgi:hypothetical protein
MARFGARYDQEDDAARLLKKSEGCVTVAADGSVRWTKVKVPGAIPCPKTDAAARKLYTQALREHWQGGVSP